MDALVGVPVAAGVGARVAAAPGHARAAEERRRPGAAVDAVAVAVAGDEAEVGAGDAEPRPAEERPFGGRGRRGRRGRRRCRRSSAPGAAASAIGICRRVWRSSKFTSSSRCSAGSPRRRLTVRRTRELPRRPSRRARTRSGPVSSIRQSSPARVAVTGSSQRSVWKVQVSVVSRRSCRRRLSITSVPASSTAPRPPLRSATVTRPFERASRRGGEGRRRVGHGGPGAGVDLELAAAGGGDVGLEEDARDQLVRVGLHLLERHRRAGLVADPAVAPVVEVEVGLGLDEGAARPVVGVEDDDLVRVDARERAVGPAAGEVVEHLLAGDPGAALHGADAVPGGRGSRCRSGCRGTR